MRHVPLLPLSLGWAFIFCVSHGGCGDTPPPTPPVVRTDSAITFNLDSFTIPSGAEALECFYMTLTSDSDWSVPSAYGMQGPGGHHITVYYYSGPPQPVEHHPCADAEMLNWRLVAGTAGHDMAGGEGTVALPDGLAIKVPQGHQIVIQAHYINATSQDVIAHDTVTVNLEDPAKKVAFANYIVANNDGFVIPAATPAYHTEISCSIPQDLQIVLYLGHMHEHGKHFQLAQLDGQGQVSKILYEYDWNLSYVSHPPVTKLPMQQPMILKKDTKLRVACDFQNDSAAKLAFPREMCLSFMYYYPDAGELDCLH